MNKDKLKELACQAIDDHIEKIYDFAVDIYNNPELGYKEFRTTQKVADFMESLGLEVEKDLAITGCRARVGKKEGPRVCLMGELDSVITPDHEDAFEDGACHTCGHNNQLAAMLGGALGIMASGVIDHLDGSIDFLAVPAEEFIELDYRAALIEEGKISYAGGKQELFARGYFDDVDISMIMHSQDSSPGTKAGLDTTSNGFIGKKVKFIGREAHSGATPHLGINALNAANLALANINAQRETFEDKDHIRVHPIITKGGDIVNVVPADVRMETYVRGASIEAIDLANKKVNRSLKAGAMAVGAQVEIQEIPGYLPLKQSPELSDVFKENLTSFIKEEEISRGGSMAGSTDFGDLTHVMPGIHPNIGGVMGALHTREYRVTDWNLAYIVPAKVFAMTLIDLLYDGGKKAREVIEAFEPTMSKEEYLAYLKENSSKKLFSFED